MRKIATFAFGVLVGTVVATAWANFSHNPRTNEATIATGLMNPFAMMMQVRSLPVHHHDAF